MEPILHLLGVNFDTNIARDIMTEKPGTITRVMYQLFVALSKKEKANLSGVAMETMRPAAPVKLEAVGSKIYKEVKNHINCRNWVLDIIVCLQRLKQMTPRQSDMNLESLVARFHEKQMQLEETAFRERCLKLSYFFTSFLSLFLCSLRTGSTRSSDAKKTCNGSGWRASRSTRTQSPSARKCSHESSELNHPASRLPLD